MIAGLGEAPLPAGPRGLLFKVAHQPWRVPSIGPGRVISPGQWSHQCHCPHLLQGLPMAVDQVGLPMWLPRQCQGTSPIITLTPTPSGPSRLRPTQQSPLNVKTYRTSYGTITLVHVPGAVFSAALALGCHQLRDFYTREGTLRTANDKHGRPGAAR